MTKLKTSKQSYEIWSIIALGQLDYIISDVSGRGRVHFIFSTGLVRFKQKLKEQNATIKRLGTQTNADY